MKILKYHGLLFSSLILALFCQLNSALAQTIGDSAWSTTVSHQTMPACQNSASDTDGDGWGWENKTSCKIIEDSSSNTSETLADNTNYDGLINIASIEAESGFAYLIRRDFGTLGDNIDNSSISALRVFEDGVELTKSHSAHSEIREIGSGSFSHWNNKLYFSSTDNSDPRENGRVYSFIIGDQNNSNEEQNETVEQPDLFDEPVRIDDGPSIDPARPITTNPDLESSDLRTRLLASPDRIGYGRNATGGSNYVYVKNFNELKEAMGRNGSYVVLDPSLAGKGIGFTSPIYTASNVTLDGSLAPGAYFHPIYPGYPVNVALLGIYTAPGQGENVIFHNFTLKGNRSSSHDKSHPSYNVGGINIRGKNIWVNRVEVTNFWDDAMITGQQGDYVTFSNLKIYNTDKGIQFYHVDYGPRHISIFNSDLSAAQRTPNNKGASHAHIWNNYIHDVKYGASSAGYARGTLRGMDLIRTISENNYFENIPKNGTEFALSLGETIGGRYPVQVAGSIYSNGNKYNGGNVWGITRTSSYPWTIPYDYSLMPASEVKNYVRKNAGPKY